MKKILIALLLLGLTVSVFLCMRPTAKLLKTADTPLGILNLEFAYDSSHTSKVINAWNENNSTRTAKENTYLDFGFIFFYSLFLIYACRNLSKNFTSTTRRIGILFSYAAFFAGILDVLENAGMLLTLHGNRSSVVSFVTTICASLKWLLVLAAVLYVIVAGFVSLYKLIAYKKKNSH